MIKLLFENHKENLEFVVGRMTQTIQDSVTTQISAVSSEIFSLSKKYDEELKINSELRRKIEQLEATNSGLVSSLEKANMHIDEVEQYQRRTCLVVSNLQPADGKSDEDAFLDLCRDKMRHLNVTKDQISKIHRLPRPTGYDNNKPQALVVKFAKGYVTYDDKCLSRVICGLKMR